MWEVIALDIADTTFEEGFGAEVLAAVVGRLPVGGLQYFGTVALLRSHDV
jgi:hypothetical protein